VTLRPVIATSARPAASGASSPRPGPRSSSMRRP
jgi:hypothetical protein